MGRPWDGRVPFNPENGDLQHYPSNVFVRCPDTGNASCLPPDWRDNIIFEDTLRFAGFTRGRSAAYAEFLTSSNIRVNMFLADLSAAMDRMTGGWISGRFTYCKRGANFGVVLIPLREG